MAAGRQRRAEADTFTARWKKQWHRARVGMRRSAVDYFRGDGLGLDRPGRSAADDPRHRRHHDGELGVVLTGRSGPADRRGRPAAAPGEPARPVRGGGHGADRGVRATGPVHRGPLPGHPRRGPGRRGLRLLRTAGRPVPQPGRRALAARRHHALRPARTHPGPEQAARCRRAGTGDGAVPRPAASPSPATSLSSRPARTAAGRSRWSSPTCPARAWTRARAPCCCRARLADCWAASPPHAFPPAANGYLLRQDWDEVATSIHPRTGPRLRRLRAVLRRTSAGPPAQRGHRRWEEKTAEGPLLRVRRCAVRPGEGGPAPRRRADAVHGRPGGDLDRDIAEGIDRLTGEADRYVAGGFHGAAWHLIEAVAKDVNDDRGAPADLPGGRHGPVPDGPSSTVAD